MILSDNNLKKINEGRNIIDVYRSNNIKTKEIIKKTNDNLKKLGFSTYNDFISFSMKMNIYEIDRCFAIKYIYNEHTALCCAKSCRKNAPTCFSVYSFASDPSLPLTNLMNPNESKILKSQYDEIYKRNIPQDEVKVLVTPMEYIYYQHFENHTPTYCYGRFVKIFEPRFDVLWETKKFAYAGHSIQQLIDKQFIKQKREKYANKNN